MVLVMRRAALFVAIVLVWALLAATAARSATIDRDIVAFSGFRPGTIVVKTNEHRLYFVLDKQRALRFPVGGFVSHGCIRMYNRDIREFYRLVDVGTPVIVEQ